MQEQIAVNNANHTAAEAPDNLLYPIIAPLTKQFLALIFQVSVPAAVRASAGCRRGRCGVCGAAAAGAALLQPRRVCARCGGRYPAHRPCLRRLDQR